MTGMPALGGELHDSPISQGLPNRWVTMIAFVRGERHARMVSAVTLQVRGSTSAKTGIAPW